MGKNTKVPNAMATFRTQDNTVQKFISQKQCKDTLFCAEMQQKKQVNTTETQHKAFAEIQELRQTEYRTLIEFLRQNKDVEYTRNELAVALGKPLNHITRMVYDAIRKGAISVTGERQSTITGRLNETVKLCNDGE